MGIKGLMKLLDEEAPGCYRETTLDTYLGRVVAIDASMQLYQFMIQIRAMSGGNAGSGLAQQLTNADGEVTSHIHGFFTRSIRLMESGLKPVFVFDGKPPTLKGGILAKRKAQKEKAERDLAEAEAKLAEASETADAEARDNAIEEANRLAKRSIHVTKEHNEDIKQLLKLMGIPVIEAPCEAEAQCAELCKKGKVFAIGTEDMDSLTFGTPILLRNLTQPQSVKKPVLEIHYAKLLGPDGLNMTKEQFIDLCILCGCDYCENIKGIGPKTALKLIREHGSLEEVLKNIDRTKHSVPEDLEQNLPAVRNLFVNPEVTPGEEVELTFSSPDEEAISKYLCEKHGFDPERVKKSLERLKKAKSSSSQKRMESFFIPTTSKATDASAFKKRQPDAQAAKKGAVKKQKR